MRFTTPFLLWYLALFSMAGAAQAQVTAQGQAVVRPYNAPTDFTFLATDATPGGPYAIGYAITTPPAHGSLGPVLSGGRVRYTPDLGYVGDDSFSFTASTANGSSAPATIGITLQPPVAPVAYGGGYDVLLNTRADLLLKGENPNARTDLRVYFELVAPPLYGTVVFGDYNAVSYTPAAGYSGPDRFTFRVRHPEFGLSNVAIASITVAAPTLPVARPGSGYVPHGTATAIALTAQDANAGGPYALAYVISTPPAHGSISISGSTATYTPASGYWGADSFAFTATSVNGTSAPATVSVLVGQAIVLGHATGALGDTGQTLCTDSAGGAVACAALTAHPGQDGRFGPDAQAGRAAFDFVAEGSDCVADRVTGLVWGTTTQPAQSWVDATSAAASAARCGIATGWRLPTRRELLSIVHHGASQPAIDASAFPTTQNAPYWSSDTQGSQAWAVDFTDGATLRANQGTAHAARQVVRPPNQAPTITLGAAEIVIPNDERPGPRTYPGWATGIGPGAARESGQQLFASVRLLPVPGIKTLEFDVPPAIDPATGDLTFTVMHRISLREQASDGTPRYYWASSAGRVQVEVTLQDDGGTVGGGQDRVTRSFEIFISPVPNVNEINIKHAWKAACIPVTMLARDIDTDPTVSVIYPGRYAPIFKIKTYPNEGFLTDYVSRSMAAKSISVPLGDTVPDDVLGTTGNSPGATGNSNSPRGFWASTVCYVPMSSTFTGFDTFTYSAIDVDGNESAPASVTIEIFQPR